MAIDKKPWYQSKSKWAGILAGAGVIIGGLVSWLNGAPFPITEIYTGIIVILAVFGIRNLPVLNKK